MRSAACGKSTFERSFGPIFKTERIEEIVSEKAQGQAPSNKTESITAAVKNRFSAEQKIAIFRKLFRGREDVYLTSQGQVCMWAYSHTIP